MRSLNDQLDLEAALAVWDRSGVLWLQPGADPLLVHREPGDCVAAGTVLLAGRPDAEVEAASDLGGEPLRGRLEHVRAGGMIGDFRAGNGGACSLAAPIVDAAGAVLAALSVQAPRARWQVHKHEFTCALRTAALRLTSSLSKPDRAPSRSVGYAYGNSRRLSA
jgi:DNA-binding IclR family transcriptional regulator